MASKQEAPADPLTNARPALRNLLFFQVKLALDAARDFALSPISIIAFLLDLVIRPAAEKSYYLRLMQLGQRSDEIINLFEQHQAAEHYTVDKTLGDVERGVGEALRQRNQK
ncbi:hypothetical protein EYC98_05960 [Halieaceae bacterium IMCC14734]|uniref:Uncharacterized protein n=1 Tax=Candidatus Litorirhabdus singularis TaxID=2518993 RepID=A0ABT3TF63_9GAMM|nr:hypothetical protein [Candidatus Litorirhabdus singularis]MCX2980416.1 hypothetical protein [Candidatus Litorirhabdus singularis]